MNTKYLIVNADDYGYYSCVSKGILQGAKSGSITATGIMANSPYFDEHIDWLKPLKELDQGVHLNLSHGRPLSNELRSLLSRWKDTFPDKMIIVKSILSGTIPISAIENEWRSQIERCINKGVNISFLNSHEHLHMLPPLYKIFLKLVDEYQLNYSRLSTPEWQFPIAPGSLFRNSALALMNCFITRRQTKSSPILLGMNASGKLNIAYLTRIFKKLKSDNVYELMCHPGYFDETEIADPNLLRYHHWQGELELLLSDEFKNLCSSEHVKLINYRSLANLA